jgi:hypothetical protein
LIGKLNNLRIYLTIIFACALIDPTISYCQQNKGWTDNFDFGACQFSPTGKNDFFILEPGYKLVLGGIENGETTQVEIIVLGETKQIGDYETRVVVEKESVNRQLKELSRNYYAFCPQTGSVFYFGEDVDIYEDGQIASHEGSWRAYEDGNQPGLMMPGMPLIGSRYYQELAPGIAVDRAEIIDINSNIETPAGKFSNCLKTEETSASEPQAKEYKYYATGIGLAIDAELKLIEYGYIGE